MNETVQLILKGLLVTIGISAGGMVLAIIFGLFAGLGKLSRDPIVRWYSNIYVETFRGTSALVQLFWFFFALPILIGYSMPAWVAGVLVLGLNVGAYGAEVVRGGIESVSTGQHEAAIALGYSRHQKMRHIILPQAVPIILPPAGNLLIELMKVSALVSLITIPDLTFAAERIRDHTMQTGAIYGLALVLYFLIAMAISLGIQKLEKRFSFGKS